MDNRATSTVLEKSDATKGSPYLIHLALHASTLPPLPGHQPVGMGKREGEIGKGRRKGEGGNGGERGAGGERGGGGDPYLIHLALHASTLGNTCAEKLGTIQKQKI